MNGLASFGMTYGWAIVTITVVIKLVFWPLTMASTRSMKRMQTLQPQMNAIKEKYKDYLGLSGSKNLVIFECNGRPYIIPGDLLGQYSYSEETPDPASNEKQRIYHKDLGFFLGDRLFSGALLAVTSSKPFTAYFLEAMENTLRAMTRTNRVMAGSKRFSRSITSNRAL